MSDFMAKFEKQRRIDRIRAMETLCGDMCDSDKHFLAERLRRYGSAGVNAPEPLTTAEFCELARS